MNRENSLIRRASRLLDGLDNTLNDFEEENKKLRADVLYWKSKFEQELRLHNGPELVSALMTGEKKK